MTVDEIPRMLEEALTVLNTLSDPFEDEKLDRALLKHKQAIAKAMIHYLIQLNINRERALKLELENLKKERAIKGEEN